MTVPRRAPILASVILFGVGAVFSAGTVLWLTSGSEPEPVAQNILPVVPQAVVPQPVAERGVSTETVAVLMAETYAARDAAKRAESMLADTQAQLSELKTLLTDAPKPAPVVGDTLVVARAAPAPLDVVAETDAGGCVDQLRRSAPAMTVFFDPGSAALNELGVLNVRAFGQLLAGCPDVIVHVTGHSDASGNEQANLNLSWARADNVVDAMDRLGFDTSHVDAVGFGIRVPSAQGDTDADRDRRVEFHILEGH